MLLASLARNGATGIRLPLCQTCRTRKVVTTRNEHGERECFRCAQRRTYGECPACLRMKKLTATNADGQSVCQRCGPDGIPTFTCEGCGRTVTTVGRMDGKSVCLNCFPRRLRRCVSCGQQKKIAANILHGLHCFACHNRVLRNAAPCPACAEKRILAFLDDDRKPCCAGRAGHPARYACRRCGSEEHHYGRLCGKCVLSDRCDDILTGPNGEFTPPMQALRDYLLTRPRPAQIIKWLRMGPSTDLLRDIASGRVPIETVLDAPRPSNPLIYLRTLLIDAGALPRDTATTRQLMAWTTHAINEAPVEHRQMLRTYTRWVLLRRASRDNTGDIAIGTARHVKAWLRGLVAFLNWADEQHTPLRSLTQAQVEEFITLRTARRWLPQFLSWAAERDITPNLDIAMLPRREPLITASEEPRRRHPHPRHGSQHRTRRTPRSAADRGLWTPRDQDIRATPQPAPRRERRPQPSRRKPAAQAPRADHNTRTRTDGCPPQRRPEFLALPRPPSRETSRPAIPQASTPAARRHHIRVAEHRPLPPRRRSSSQGARRHAQLPHHHLRELRPPHRRHPRRLPRTARRRVSHAHEKWSLIRPRHNRVMNLFDSEQRVVEAAERLAATLGTDPNHTVAAAVMDTSGRIHTAVNVYHFTGGPCAELVALGAAAATEAGPLLTIAAAGDQGRGLIPPCGRCRQALLDLHPDILVAVPTPTGPQLRPIRKLLPDTYFFPDANARRVVRFNKRYYDDVAAERKTVTVRYDDPISLGPALFVFEDDEESRTLTGIITTIERHPLDSLTAEQAKLPSDADITEFKSGLQKHYPGMPHDAQVDVVTFSLTSNDGPETAQ